MHDACRDELLKAVYAEKPVGVASEYSEESVRSI
jgi:hypothetical protein